LLCEKKAPIAAASLAAIVALVAAAALTGGGIAPAAAAECEWRPHKVRVVKHVKRHGKRVKLVRKRVRWSCVAIPSAPATPTPAPSTPPPAPAPAPPPAPPVFSPEDLSNPHFLGTQAYEFGFTPTKPGFELQAGADTIQLVNGGEDAHDLHLESLATHTTVLEVTPTGPNGTARASAVLEAGEYRLYCSLADHVEKGMERTLVVTP
jgi:plastocyanin